MFEGKRLDELKLKILNQQNKMTRGERTEGVCGRDGENVRCRHDMCFNLRDKIKTKSAEFESVSQ